MPNRIIDNGEKSRTPAKFLLIWQEFFVFDEIL